VAVLAGADASSDSGCHPSRPVSVLHLHGDVDRKVPFAGGTLVGPPFPGAAETVARWAQRNGCGTATLAGTAIDLEAGIVGPETSVSLQQSCPPGIDVQLDTIVGAQHSPQFIADSVGVNVIDWLLAHSR
jgi:polyhydroxybutyrate depolymerase